MILVSSSNVHDAKKFAELKMDAGKNVESRLNIIKKLVILRSLPAFVHGDYNSTVLNSNVFTFTRYRNLSKNFVRLSIDPKAIRGI